MSDVLRDVERSRIEKCLKAVYQGQFSDQRIQELVDVVLNRDYDTKLPKSSRMIAYSAFDQRIKDAEENKKALRVDLITEIQDLDHPIEGIKYRKDKRLTWNESKFFEWVAETFPEWMDDITIKTIHMPSFEKKFLELDDPPNIPKECYTEKEIDVITVEYPK